MRRFFYQGAAKAWIVFGIAWICSTVEPCAQVNLTIRARQPGVAPPVCVRAEILKSDGSYLEGEWLTPTYPVVALHGKAMSPSTVVQAPSGPTRITIGRGPDYRPRIITTNLTRDTILDVTLDPVFDLFGRGWRSAEMHLHYIHGEAEVIRTPQQAWAICSGGGLDAVLFCEEHYGAGTLTRQQMYDVWTPFAATETQLGMGVEEPKNAWGHYESSAYDPWSVRSAPPYCWGIRTVHEQGGVSVPVHPGRMFPSRYYDDPSSGSRFWFLFPFNNFLKSYPVDALTGHLIDAWSGVSDEANTATVLPPYFQLLNSGYRIPLLADSDFCLDRVNNGCKATGFWMTYYYLGSEPVSRAAIAEAIRKGRVMSTTGPLVLFTIDNAMPGDTLPADGAARTVRIEANYSFNPWTLRSTTFDGSAPCRITQIDLFRNGQIIQTWTPNTPTASVQRTITETSSNSWYMVRVLGNQAQWMAGYASPIYFGAPNRRRQPPVFKSLVQGRLYDAVSGDPLTGTVSSVRYGRTDWIIPTDAQGRFQARVPLDAEVVAEDSTGRTFAQSIMKQEPVYAFCHYLPQNYGTNQGASISAFSNIVGQMRWEFPLGHKLSPSYARTTLSGEANMSGFSVLSAPPHTGGKSSAEIAMVLLDKTRVQPGDTVNFAVIYHSPQNPPIGQLVVEWKGWNSNNPSMYSKAKESFGDFNSPASLVNLGGGFYLRSGSVVIPGWVSNVAPTTGGVLMYVTVRPAGNISEAAQLLLPLGPTRRELLVSTTWDGFPATWSEMGVGPCNFRRNYTDFLVRYSDYRNMAVRLTLNGQQIILNPKADTAHVADADDAVFYEQFYYDGQCEPSYRNISFRDPVRAQPPPTDFSSVAIRDLADTSPPLPVAIEPANGVTVPEGITRLYFSVDDAGVSEPGSATVFVDGQAVTNTSVSPVALTLPRGQHTWRIQGFDTAGNSSSSALNTFIVGSAVPDTTPPQVAMTAPGNGAVVSGSNVVVSASATDNVGVASVQIQLDGLNLGAARTTAPYSIKWDATLSANGPHQLRAVARDFSSNQSTSAVVNVTVQTSSERMSPFGWKIPSRPARPHKPSLVTCGIGSAAIPPRFQAPSRTGPASELGFTSISSGEPLPLWKSARTTRCSLMCISIPTTCRAR
jgi:hypothetical protein